MLEPDTRTLLTDALRPPDGYEVDVAVATTYTLDVHSLLLAPMAMAAYAHSSNDIASANPLALLESVRRYAGRTTVFVQAGGIHVPATYPRLATFAERCVIEVLPPDGYVFHPKVWLLRFVNSAGEHHHRFACLSRNLTMDRSWDTALVLDENPDAAHTANTVQLEQLVRLLPEMASPARTVEPHRVEQLVSLAKTMGQAPLELPSPFTNGTILPFGINSGQQWPSPGQVDDLVVVSPFLDATTLARLPAARRSMLVSRSEECDRLGRHNLSKLGSTWVLQQSAEASEATDEQENDGAGRRSESRHGLHAKVFAWNLGGTGFVLTGSTNCTSAAFGGNVECGVLLEGPKTAVGVHKLFDDSSDLKRVLQPYEPAKDESSDDPDYAIDRAIEVFHVAIAAAGLALRVESEEDSWSLALETPALPSLIGESSVRPVTLSHVNARPFIEQLPRWTGLAASAVAPFVVVDTTLTREGRTVSRASVLQVELINDPPDRANHAFRELLARGEDILQYLALLLDDPSLDDLLATWTSEDKATQGRGGSFVGFDDLVLLEPLVRAAARADGALDRVNEELQILKGGGDKVGELGDEFLELWQAVWESTQND